MSTTVDERIVSMQFDNKHFETNVSTTMSTLDKLKAKLNFPGASKGIENVSAAVKKIDLTPFAKGVEAVHMKFSALDVMATTAIANITNQAVNAGKRIASALTIDPVKTGFSEYETKINSIQTIMSNTASKGTTMEDVTRVIDELNTYADKTIYNFSEMTRNIGTFTAAGVGLEESAAAIQGIANLAAASGSTSQQASTAMYQLSQALAAGTVKLMDWNSVVNAGMGGEKFQEALKATAREHGIAVDDIIKKNGSFRDSLQDGWISADILNETLNKFTVDGAKKYAKSMMDSGKWTQAQADALIKEAQSMEDAATKVKTFTQLVDTLKESLQSGWGKTWELIFGDFYEARDLFTSISDAVGGFINKMSDTRNAIIEAAMSSPFAKVAEKINEVSKATEKVVEVTKDYEAIVKKVIGGEYGNGEARWSKLTEEGYDWAKVQNMVNEQLGCSVRHNEQLSEAQGEVNTKQATTIDQLAKMNDAQLKQIGFTDDEIKSLRELSKVAEKAGYSLSEVLANPELLNGRNMLINGFKNIGKAIGAIIKPAKDAWNAIFPPKTTEERAMQLYNLIAAFHGLTSKMIVSEETADKLERTFKGVFALLDIITTIIGGPLKLGFKALKAILGAFDLDILDVTAAIGDAIVSFNNWLDTSNIFAKGAKFLVKQLKAAKTAISDFIKGVKDGSITPEMVADAIVNGLTSGIKAIGKLFGKLGDIIADKSGSIPSDLLAGLGKGILNGLGFIGQVIASLASTVVDKFKELLGIHSPSVIFMALGGFIVAGLVLGLQNGTGEVWDTIRNIGEGCIDAFSEVDFGQILSVLGGAGLLVIINKLSNSLSNAVGLLERPLAGLGDILQGAGKVLDSFAGTLKSLSFNLKTEGIKNIAISLLMLVGAVAILTFLDLNEMHKAVLIILELAAILALLAVATNMMSKSSLSIGRDGVKAGGSLGSGLVSIGVALLLLAATVKIIGNMDMEKAEQGFKGLGKLVLAIGAVLAAYGLVVQDRAADNIKNLGKMLTKLAISLLIMVGVVKLASKLDDDEMKRGGIFVAAFGIFVGLLSAAVNGAGANVSKVGGMIFKISIAMLLMVGVVKLASMLDKDEMIKGAAFAAGFVVFVGLLTKALDSKNIPKMAGLLMAVSTSMLILVGIVYLLKNLNLSDMINAGVFVAAFGVFIWALASILNNKQIPKMAATLLAVSISIGILAGISILLSLIKPENLWPGVAAVAALAVLMAGLIFVTKYAKECKSELIVLTVAIGILAVAIAALSFIDPEDLFPAVAAMGILMAIMAGMIALTKFAGSGITGTLVTLTIMVATLGVIVYALGTLPTGAAIQSAGAIAILLVSMSVSLLLLKVVGSSALMGIVALAAMTIVVGLLAGILVLMTNMNAEAAIPIAEVLGNLLLKLSAACVILTVVGMGGPAALIGVASLAAVIVVIGGLLIAIGELATMFPGVNESLDMAILIFEKIGYAMGALIGGFAAGLTAGLPEIGTNLSQFMINATPFITGLKSIDEATINSAKALAGMILAITAAQVIQGIASFFGMEMDMGAFGAQLIPFGQALVQFSSIVAGNIDESAVTAAANAGTMMADMASTVPASGGLLQDFLGEKDLGAFGEQLVSFGTAIVSFSAIVAGKIDEAAVTAAANAGKTMTEMAKTIPNTGGLVSFLTGDNSMADFGNELVSFGLSIVTFSSTVAGKIDEAAVQAAANAGGIMVALAESIPNTGGLMGFLFGDNSMSDFGVQMVDFGEALVDFSDSVSGIDVDAIGPAVEAGKKLVELANAMPEGEGILGRIADAIAGSDSEQFADACEAMGDGVDSFADEVKGINVDAVRAGVEALEILIGIANQSGTIGLVFDDEDDAERFEDELDALGDAVSAFAKSVSGINEMTVKRGVTAGKAVSEMCAVIRDNGGFSNSFGEGADLATFGSQLISFGRSMTIFSITVATMNLEQLENGVRAGKSIINMASSIPNAGGITSGIFGKTVDMATFGTQLASFGRGIKSFAMVVSGIETGGVDSAVAAGKAIIDMASSMPNTGGVFSGIFGESVNMAVFGQQLVGYARAIRIFAAETEGLNPTVIANGVAAGKIMITLSNVTPGRANLVKTGTQLVSFGKSIRAFALEIGSVNAAQMLESVTHMRLMVTMLKDLSVSGVNTFISVFAKSKVKVGSAVSEMIKAAINAMKNTKSEFSAVGKALMESFVKAVKLKKIAVKNAFKDAVKSGLSNIKSETMYTSFYNAGSYLVDGFVEGIEDNDYKAKLAAKAMAKAAKKAAEEALGINSPSKVFYAIGEFVSAGFTNALGDSTSRVSKATSDLANSATNGFNNTISKIKDLIDGKIDSQPVISPVLDLSGVESGAGALRGMLDISPSARVRANIESINASMNSRIQNGGNDDIISALKDLGNSIDGRGGDTYNIDGVTYDDGSNISNAVKTLIRAAKVERRK